MAPALTVVTPTLNASRTLHLCARSLLQAGTDVIHVVIDGGSTDSTVEVARAAGAEVVVQSPHGTGMYGALAQAFRNVATEWVTYLNADDIAWPDGYGTLLRSARQDDGVIYGDGVEFALEEGGGEAESLRVRLALGARNPAPYLDRVILPFQQPAAIVRASEYRRSSGFSDRQRIVGDVAIYRELLLAGVPFRYVAGVLVSAFRRSEDSLGGRNVALARHELELIRAQGVPPRGILPFFRDRCGRRIRRSCRECFEGRRVRTALSAILLPSEPQKSEKAQNYCAENGWNRRSPKSRKSAGLR